MGTVVAPGQQCGVSSSPSPRRRPTVVLADDHLDTARQLRALLWPHFDVVAMVQDGAVLVSAAALLSPDVIVADISMPGCDGIDAAAQIRRHNPEARIVFVTVNAEPTVVRRSLATGALGYVLKDSAGDELVAAVVAALEGHGYVSSAIGHDHETDRP